ncbi:Ni/Fe hydrogenase subunit alpha [Nocardioides pacificus]
MTHKHRDGGHVLKVDPLARVEGEGALHIVYRDGDVTDVQLRIYEPPRFYEAFLRGRSHTEPPDITARICGICPVAYQMSSCWAIEDACGVSVTDEIRALRRLLYCGEWIESHALHVYLLHAPDFLGYDGAVEMASDHPAVVERGLRLKKAGNRLMEVVGGRPVHPVNVRVGGFYRFPSIEELTTIRPDLERALEDSLETVRLVAGFDFPDFEQPYEYLALRPETGYPIEAGSVVTTSGEAFAVREFASRIEEWHVSSSNALYARLDGGARGPYAVGPLARYTLNCDRLSSPARRAAADAGLGESCRNPFRSIVVRAVELVEACHEALRIIDAWTGAGPASIAVPPRAGEGYGASEAPRGVLFHRYVLDGAGIIQDAQIVPPTSQNQAGIEADLHAMVRTWADLDEHALLHRCEHAIRNYDPCISCATHFLDLTVEGS